MAKFAAAPREIVAVVAQSPFDQVVASDEKPSRSSSLAYWNSLLFRDDQSPDGE
jgi:hypothetical protein